MLSKLVLALIVAAASIQEAQADQILETSSGQDRRLLSEECTGSDGTNIDCDPLEDQIEDALPETDKVKQKAFEKAQKPSDHMYFKSPTYKAKTRQQKMDELWKELVPTFETDSELNDVEPKDFPWEQFPNFFKQKGNGSFCQSSDEIKRSRPKTTHTQGLVAKVSWIPMTDRYTGMYASQQDEVILRLSQIDMLTKKSTGLHPSMALKFLVDGQRSSNLFATTGMKPTDSWDFMGQTMKNRLEPFDQTPDGPDWIEVQTVQKKMIEGSRKPFATGVSIIGNKYSDGTLIEKQDVRVPYELHYKSALPDDFSAVNAVDKLKWYTNLKEIPAGTDLFEVWGWTSHEECGGEYIKVAVIRLQTKLYTSVAGDERLYFQHRRVGSDRSYWDRCTKRDINEDMMFEKIPENLWGHGHKEVYDEWPADREDAEDEYLDQILENNGCPFAWLLQDDVSNILQSDDN